MSGLFFGGNAGGPTIAGFRVPTSVYGAPIPLLYGRARIAGNLIHLVDEKRGQPQAGGKAASKAGATQNTLQAALVVGLCEGPIAGIINAWTDKEGGTGWPAYLAKGWSLFLGSATQTPWGYLTSFHSAQAVPYQLLAYVANPLLDLPGGSMPSISWEIDGFLPFGGGVLDAHPADILIDFVTDPGHGLAIPAGIFGDLSAFRDFCTAAGIFLSPAYTALRPASEHLMELFQASYSAPVWSDGKLKVIPYCDTPVTGHGVTYTPNTTPLYDLTDDHFLYEPDRDPVVVTRKRPAERFNQVFVEYELRAVGFLVDPGYRVHVAEAKDQAALELGIFRPAPKIALHAIKETATARLLAQYLLQRELNVCNTYVFHLPWKFALLEPMDLVTLTDAALGMTRTPVRITEVMEEDEGIQVTAEDWPFGTASAARYVSQVGSGTTSNQGIAPGDTSTPTMFDSSGALDTDPLRLCIAASGGASWGGCDVHVSTDNVRYYKVGTITRRANYGVLTASLAKDNALPAIDTTHTLAVDLSASAGALASGASTDVPALLTLCWVDGEFLSFQTATLTGLNQYALTTLGRGAYATTPKLHPIGAKFVRVDDAVLQIEFPQGSEGQLLYVKLPAFNVYGKALQDLSTVPVFSHTIANVALQLEMRVVQSEPYAGQITADVYIADPAPSTDPILVSASSFGTMLLAPESDTLTYPTDPVTSDLDTTDFVRFVIGQPPPGSATGGVTFRATKAGKRLVERSIDVPAQNSFGQPSPTIGPLTAEGTGAGGNKEGIIHIPLVFDVNTTEFRIFAAEAAAAGVVTPDISTIETSGVVTRQEGVTASAVNWATMWDISTTPGFYRKIIIVPSGPGGALQPFIEELQAIDTGTGPTAAPSSLVVTPSNVIVGGRALVRETVTWTIGDVLAFTRVHRNGIIVKIVAPGTATFVDDDVAPNRVYTYAVDHYRNGQTSGAPVDTHTSTTPTLQAPTWMPGYPVGGVDSLDGVTPVVFCVWDNPDPLARSLVYQSHLGSDGPEPFPLLVDDVEPGRSFTVAALAPGGATRWFYVKAKRDGYTDSVGSTHRSAVYGP